MSAIALDGPARGVAREVITANNNLTVQEAPVFIWDAPQPVAKDPVISTPDKKAPTGIKVCNSYEHVPTETVTSNAADCVNNTSALQQDTTPVPPFVICQSQKQGACKGPTKETMVQNKKMSDNKNPKKTSLEKIQINADEQRSNCKEAFDCKVLGRKRTRNKPVNVTSHLCDDDKQNALEAEDIIDPKRKKFDHTSCCTVAKELDRSEGKSDAAVAASAESKIPSSATESKPGEESKTVSFLHKVFYDNQL